MKLAIALLAALVLLGCGSAVDTHTAAITVAAGFHSTAGGAVDAARGAALDAVEAEHPTVGDERTAALRAEASRWEPIGAALDASRTVLVGWLGVVSQVEAGADVWELVPPLVGRLVTLWGDVVRLAAGLGLELPALPSVVTSLAGAL